MIFITVERIYQQISYPCCFFSKYASTRSTKSTFLPWAGSPFVRIHPFRATLESYQRGMSSEHMIVAQTSDDQLHTLLTVLRLKWSAISSSVTTASSPVLAFLLGPDPSLVDEAGLLANVVVLSLLLFCAQTVCCSSSSVPHSIT